MKFIELTIVTSLFLLVKVLGQCDNSAGCFPPTGNIALFRNISTSSTCGENGTTVFTPALTGSGMQFCSADDPTVAYPASNINDNDTTTAWQSDTGVTNVTVQLDLEGPMLFESLTIIWSTPRPSAMIIERSSDFGNTWVPYRFYSTNCVNFFMINATIITSDTILDSTEAVCTEIEGTFFPTSGSEITFDISSHLFPGITEDEQWQYQTITNLRLQLLGTHAVEETEQYYGIFEWSVYGSCLCNGHADECIPLPGEIEDDGKIYAGCNCQHRTDGPNCEICQPLYNNAEYMRGTTTNASVCQMCQCFGHADSCVYNDTLGFGQCMCTNNTQGVMCEECVAGFYRDPAMLFSDPCIDCGCFLPGVSNPMICDSSTGVCSCKSNIDTTSNTICDTCMDGFWNISDSNPDGCQACSCNSVGSTNQVCDKTLGNCTCTSMYLPPLCSDCTDGFFLNNDDRCIGCDCNPAGAINDSCTALDGVCFCKDNIVNIKCDAPANGFYTRPLDFFVFEAEDTTFSNDFTEVFPVVSQPTNFTGQGFLMFGSILTITFSVPTTYQYELVLRYSAMGDTVPVILDITSLEEVNITLECDSTSGIAIRQGIFASLEETEMPNHGAEAVIRICLEAGVMYNVMINRLPFTTATFLLDSVLLLPLFATQSAYLNSQEGMDLYADTLDSCLPREVGPTPVFCDPLTFILSVEFFGQVYPCDCDPIGTLRVDECSVDGGVCVCKPGVGGRQCDRCIPSFYNFSNDGCTACNCNPAGVVDITDCDPDNGTCMCKANVDTEVNSVCDTCQDGFWNISTENPDGCQECMCDPVGSSDSVCDKVFGNCSCNANFIGRTCSECAVDYYVSNNQCVPCDCHPVGSLDTVCDVMSGQCSCLPNINGRTCNETVPGYYYRALDYIRFEAEDLSYPEGFSEVLPITNNPVYDNNFTGRGYIAFPRVGGRLEFLISVPESSRYEVILRYRFFNMDQTIISLNVDSLMETNNSLGCDLINANVSQNIFMPISSQQTFHMFLFNACFDRGTQYLVTVDFDQFLLPSSEAILEVDSVVLIPRFEETSSYYNTQPSAQIEDCIPRAAGSVPPTNTACTETTFSLSVEFYGQVVECNCDSTGAVSDPQEKPCDCNGGYCPCKDGVGGKICDRCLNGYFNLSTNGCAACACDVDNSNSFLCDDNGQCSCAMGITGLQCNECEDGRFNFGSSGCQLCNCEPLGSTSNICDKVTGACQCVDGVIGDLCDACPLGSILTNSIYQRLCEPCRCYNQSDLCTVDTTYSLAAISSDFIQICNSTASFVIETDGWMIEGNGTFTRCTENGLGYNSSDVDMDRLVAPDNFTGDLTGSYSLQLSVLLRLPQNARLHSNTSTVELCGPGRIECLIGEFECDSSNLETEGLLLLTISFREMYWRFQVDPNSQPTYLEFLYTLTDVTSLSFPASFAMVETYYLQSVSLQTIVSNDTVTSSDLVIIQSVFPVEICQQCSNNYTGRFCEQCASGFYRPAGGLQCVVCDCNNLSTTCDPQTGICFGCTGNATGNNCDECVTGTFGDPSNDIPCQPCQCDVAKPECILEVDGNQTCINCPFGMAGRNCDVCADNFTLTPSGLRCFRCDCFGNAMPSPGEPICDMVNGQCANCSFNTTGPQCQFCLDGYFGDPTGSRKCSECTCHANGTEGLCVNQGDVGVCTCRPGTTGANCDECILGYWGLHLGGCRPCDCCANGSVNGSCDQSTGRCYCLPGVGSDTDYKCCDCSFGNYDFVSGVGCQDCGCSEGAVTPQCNENGTCMCIEGAVGEKCEECGFEYSGTVPNCERCPVCFDEAATNIEELMANISSLSVRIDQLNSSRTPLEDINATISDLEYQLSQVELAVQYRLVTRANVIYLEVEANNTKDDLAMLQQNFTMVMDLVNGAISTVADYLEIILSFNGTINGTGVADVHTRLQSISATILNLNSSTFASFQTLQQSLLAAETLQDDFDNARNNISNSQSRLDEVLQLVSIAGNLSDTAANQNLYNRGNLSLLNVSVAMLQSELQMQLLRVNTSTTQLEATYSTAMALWDTLIQTEEEIQNTSLAVQNLHNHSNTTFDLATNALTILHDLDENVTRLMSRTEEFLQNINTQQEVIVNATQLVMMVNVTAEDTLSLMTPSIELAEMLAREINSTFPSDEDIATISMTINNGTLIAQQTLEIARNASEIAGNISLIVNRTVEQINTTQLLYDQVDATYQQLLIQQASITNNTSQVTINLATFNASLMQVNNMLEAIDVAISDAYAIGIDNYNRSMELSANASNLCTAANTLEQRSAELNSSVAELSSEIDVIEQNGAIQLNTVQTLYDNATAVNDTAHSVPLQQLQNLLDAYLAERRRVTNLTTRADFLRSELDQLLTDIQQSSVILRECTRTP